MLLAVSSLRLTAYTSIALIHARMAIVRRIDAVSTAATIILLAYGMAFLWRTLYGNDVVSPHVSLDQMITYAVLGVALAGAAHSLISYEVEWQLSSGEIAIHLARPINWQFGLMAQYAGVWAARIMVLAVPAAIFGALALGIQGPRSWIAGIAFVPSVILGVIINFGILFLVMQTAFQVTRVHGIEMTVWAIRHLLSGALVPLWLFPSWFESVLAISPFPAIHFAPLAIYVGSLQDGEILGWLGRQLFWAVVLTVLGTYLSSRNLRRLVVQGG